MLRSVAQMQNLDREQKFTLVGLHGVCLCDKRSRQINKNSTSAYEWLTTCR